MSKPKTNAWKLAFVNLPKPLKILLFLAILIVVFYHVQQFCEQVHYYIFNLNSTYFAIVKVTSEFGSKLAYAIITSSIFYFIIQQFPKEKKRMNIAQFLSNSFQFIQSPFKDFEFDLFQENIEEVTAEDYKKFGDITLLDEPVRKHLANCISWHAFTLQTLEKTIIKIDETSQLSDLLNSEIFILLQKIKSNCLTVSNLLQLRSRSMKDSSKLSYISSLLFGIHSDLVQLGKLTEKFITMYTGRVAFKSLL